MEIEPGQAWQADLFRPEDAGGVAELFLMVYGQGYPIQTYLDAERLREENAAKRIISSVARTPRGDIVAHNALFRSAPWEGVYESGAGVVHPQYRGGKGLFTGLIEHGLKRAAPAFDVSGVYGEAVCNHVFSQKATHGFGMVTCAIEVDLMPAEAYAKEQSAAGRVASIFDFITLRPRRHSVHVPSRYAEAFRFLYRDLDDQRDLEVSEAPLPAAAISEVTARVFDFAQVARIAVHRAGGDVLFRLEEQESDAVQQGVRVLQIWLNLAEPWVGAVADGLRARGYFLGGLLPRWFDSDGMLLQKVLHRPHWEDIHLHFDRAKRIRDLAFADWKETAGA